jgi:hypothetical protein
VKYREILIELDAEPFCPGVITITEDASDLLLLELSIRSYMVGLSIIHILRDTTPLIDSLLTITAAVKDEVMTLS